MPATGRRAPSDDKHLRKYPFRGAARGSVESVLRLPEWAPTWNQRKLDACAGFASAMALSICNEIDARAHDAPPFTRKYDAVALWWMARLSDEFADNDDLTDPNQGTTIRAVMEILRTLGPKLMVRGNSQEPDPSQGVKEYRWGKSLDDIRAALAGGMPVVFGLDAWQGLAHPKVIRGETWVGEGVPGWERGLYLGPHTVAIAGVSDHRGAVLLQNSWNLPAYWMKYEAVEKEIDSGRSEITLFTDRPGP